MKNSNCDLNHVIHEFGSHLPRQKFRVAFPIYFVIQSISMKIFARFLAALELLLVFPAVLFMASLFLRSIQPVQLEPAHSAQAIVDWYAARPVLGLWVLLGALPMAVLAMGLINLRYEWRRNEELREATRNALALIRSHAASMLVASATVVACCILLIVALHVLTN